MTGKRRTPLPTDGHPPAPTRGPWAGSTRRARLPDDWPQRVRQIKARDRGQCQATDHAPRCDGRGTDVDHIEPGDDHSLENLQLLSRACHVAKTARETAERNRTKVTGRKRPERHPGTIGR